MRAAVVVALCSGLAACGSCSKPDGGAPQPAASSASSSSSSSAVVAERLPRCRGDLQRLAVPGEEVVAGDVAIGPSGLLVGLVRMAGDKRVASVMRASLDLATSSVVDVGPAFGDDPPPSPRWNGASPVVAYLGRQTADAGPKLRVLRIARLGEGALGPIEATLPQQADESTAFDVAWSEGGGGLAAWDEDAPPKSDAGVPVAPDRGFVKVQAFGETARPRVASPDTSDAESPRLLSRPGGFWLAWLARRAEGDDSHFVEGPGEKRAFRWVEVTMLDARGESAGPVRRVSSDRGRAASFELARDQRNSADLVVMVQDEGASSEGAGSRIVRHVVRGSERVESADLVDGGVGSALAELVPASAPNEAARWLAWTDTAEHAHLTPLGSGLVASGPSTLEPSLDGARVLAAGATPPADSFFYALVGASPGSGPSTERSNEGNMHPHPELRRFACK